MKLVLHNGDIKEVDTSCIFNNQYNTTTGQRIYDSQVKYILDDIRLGDFYCCSKKQGTYEEVAQAIAEERSKINQCAECWLHHKLTRIEDECTSEEIREGNRIIQRRQTVYEKSCAHGNGCAHNIEETPQLFREKNFCFFCEYPQGIPDQSGLRKFMIDNAEKYNIVPYWDGDPLTMEHRIKHNQQFGSYIFESSASHSWFDLYNMRNHFSFYVDFVNKKFILVDYIGYEVKYYLGVEKYNHETHISTYEPIKNYNKFSKWFWGIVEDYCASQKEETKA
jgi:hypothetical protein